jgi:hypothetical protein
MSTTTDLPAGTEAYLAAVRARLADLPAAERDDLMAEVESSLRDAEHEGGPVAARLGSPDDFVTELRAAAGLDEISVATPRGGQSVFQAFEALVAHRGVAAALGAGRDLAPLWWVARGYTLTVAAALAFQASWSTRAPAVPVFQNVGQGALAIAVAVLASLALGLFQRRRASTVPRRRLGLAVNLAGLVFLVPAAPHIFDNLRGTSPSFAYLVQPAPVQPGLVRDGAPVRNIYPYSSDGRLLHDVLLYDAQGKPLTIAANPADIDRRVLRSKTNRPVLNAFPIRYYDPGTRRISHPNAGPKITTPKVLASPYGR